MKVQFESSTACNAKCKFCPRYEMTRPMGEMSDDLFRKIIKDGKEINTRVFSPFLNGEPFVFPRIWEWLDYMASQEVYSSIYTNAERMDADRLAKAENIYYVNCSLNGTSQATYDKLMPGIDYERCKRNIEELIKKANFMIRVSIVVNEENQHEMEDFKKMWGKRAKIRPFKTYTGARHSLVEEHGDREPCYAALNTLIVLWDGRVAACCMDYDGKLILGDVNKNTLKEIWWQSGWFRKKHRRLEFDMVPCNDCNYNIKC